MEVRLVRKTAPDGTDIPVERDTEKTFLKVTKSRRTSALPTDKWTIDEVEVLKLIIPSGESKSIKDKENPVPDAVLKPKIRVGWETVVNLLPVDLKVDTDRNGEVNAVDESGEEEWRKERGAIYQVNFDGDGNNTHNGKPAPDGALWWSRNDRPDFESWTIHNDEDGLDLAPLRISPLTGIGEDAKVFLSVAEEEDHRAIHLYPSRDGGTEAIWGGILSADRPWTDGDADPLDIEITKWVNTDVQDFQDTRPSSSGDFEFGVEGIALRGMTVPGGSLPGWPGRFSGEIELTLQIELPGQPRIDLDTVKLKVAPWLMAHSSASAETTFVAQLNSNPVLHNLPHAQVLGSSPSQFTQDQVEFGYTQFPGAPVQRLAFALPYGQGKMATWLLDNYLEPGKGVFGIGDTFDNKSYDYGGNLELCPPHENYPLGRILFGTNMDLFMRKFLVSQEVQLPFGASDDGANPGGIDVGYLSVGHVDEIVNFQEDGTVLVADPSAGIQLLESFTALEKLEGVLFSKASAKPSTGQVAQDVSNFSPMIIVTDEEFAISGQDWQRYVGGYIRIATGTAKGQMARISAVGEHSSGPQEGKIAISFDLCYQTGTTSLTESARFRYLHQSVRPGNQGWFVKPKANDYFILLEDSDVLWWLSKAALDFNQPNPDDGLPAPITVGELVQDSAFLGYNEQVRQKIDAALSVLPASILQRRVPVLFHAPSENEGKAFVPNAVNCQQIGGTSFYPKQFGPRDPQNEDVFKRSVEDVLGNAADKDVWKGFHLFEGQVHCGANVARTPLADWWKELQKP